MVSRVDAISTENSVNLPDLNAMMQFWIELLGLDKPDQYGGKPWKITWAWADSIPHPNGGDAVGLNTGNGKTQTAHITIRKPRTNAELLDLDDTIAHEAMHCVGERMQALLSAGKDVEAHEYLAETTAPALVKIKGTPKAKSFAKAARTLPARAKETTNMPEDIASLEKAMIEARLAGDTAKVAELFDKWLAAKVTAQSGVEAAPASVPAPALGAAPTAPEEKKPEPPPALGMGEPERYKKLVTESIDALVEMRPDLTPEQKAHVKGLPTVEAAKTYFKAHPMATKITPAPQLGIPAIPRGTGTRCDESKPSGDKHTMKLFRIMPGQKSELPENSGVEVFDPKTTGKLVQFSIVDAYNTIRQNTEHNIELAKAKRVSA